jgi:adenine-specific DNA-methyltransferase
MVTTVTNPKGVTQGRFSRVEEYVIYCFAPEAFVYDSDDNLLNPPELSRKPRWKGLLRSGTNARRTDRKNMFYPVLVDEKNQRVVGTGESLPFELEPDITEKIDGYTTAWPIRTDGSYGNWGVGYITLRKLIDIGSFTRRCLQGPP